LASNKKDKAMNEKEPIVLTFSVRELVRQGMDFAVTTLGLKGDISENHPLRKMARVADQHFQAGGWGSSREINQLGLWGMRLWLVKDWGGFDSLVDRLKRDLLTPDAFLHEASVAAMFALVGAKGRFFNRDEQGPDLHITEADSECYVECKRSRSLSKQLQKESPIWQAVTDRLLPIIRGALPSAAIGIYPLREAEESSGEILEKGVEVVIQSYKDSSSPETAVIEPNSSDGAYSIKAIIARDPEALFKAAAAQHPGIAIPEEFEPISLTVNLKLSKPPKCTGFWVVRIDRQLPWEDVEKAILSRVDKKATQLNRFWKEKSNQARVPSLIWIEHPSITKATPAQMLHLLERLRGKMRANADGHFAGVDSVLVAVSRMLLTRDGQLLSQQRIHSASKDETGRTQFVSREWWLDLLEGRMPETNLMGSKITFYKM
jgi:hypothetical protein